jgi:delta24-sterol reductase
MHGEFAEVAPKNGVVNQIGRWYKPWFFKHVESMLYKTDDVTEYIPIRG